MEGAAEGREERHPVIGIRSLRAQTVPDPQVEVSLPDGESLRISRGRPLRRLRDRSKDPLVGRLENPLELHDQSGRTLIHDPPPCTSLEGILHYVPGRRPSFPAAPAGT
jgi:hypothetical protein